MFVSLFDRSAAFSSTDVIGQLVTQDPSSYNRVLSELDVESLGKPTTYATALARKVSARMR